MKRLSKKQIGRAACTILQQLALTTPFNVVYSWGITNKVATQIEIMVDGTEKAVAALMMDVNGFNYQGRHVFLHSINHDFYLSCNFVCYSPTIHYIRRCG